MARGDLGPGVRERLQKVRLLAMDVDGVLTEGQIHLSPSGEETKAFHARDGIGLKCLHLAGLQSAIITARGSPAVQRRAEELGVGDVILQAKDKRADLLALCERRGLAPEEVAFIGDDLQDLAAMLTAGVAMTVADAPEEVRSRAHLVTEARGGRGAVREAVEALLRAQSRWDEVLKSFLP